MRNRSARELLWISIIALGVCVLVLMAGDRGTRARAANLSWDPGLTNTGTAGGSGNWDLNSTNAWFNGTADVVWTDSSPTGIDTATFSGTAGSVSLNSDLSALGLVFGTPGYTISGSTLTLGSGGIDGSG